MEADDVRVLTRGTNSWVVSTPARRYPGIIIQGDSLKVLHDAASALVALLDASAEDAARAQAEELESLLRGYLIVYEEALSHCGLTLPYGKPVTLIE
jgi:class 3 adenylate cyclase